MMNADTLRAAPHTLHTPRLRLENPRAEHAAAVMDSVNASLPELRYIGWGQGAFDVQRALRFCEHDRELVAAGECLIYFAFERAGGAFVGNLDLHSFAFEVPRCEIGYVGDVRLAGRGLMFEAATEVLRLGFALGVLRIEARCDARNLRSITSPSGSACSARVGCARTRATRKGACATTWCWRCCATTRSRRFKPVADR